MNHAPRLAVLFLTSMACNPSEVDFDQDGITFGDDCDDESPELGARDQDADCDGYVASDDCDDTVESLFSRGDDADCDAVLLADDCDDADAGLLARADDADCDRVPTADDCDDGDAGSLSRLDDADCDRVPTTEDCDDSNADILSSADDADCDQVPTAEDCDDTDASVTALTGVPVVGGPLGLLSCIPAGSFEMGCKAGRDDLLRACGEYEYLADTTLTRPFWMMQTEVTNAQWSALIGQSVPSTDKASYLPLNSATWFAALRLANAASAADGYAACYVLAGCSFTGSSGERCDTVTVDTTSGSPYDCEGYRLPTEAEWEYAARAGQAYALAGGDDANIVGWYAGNRAVLETYVSPPCQKLANAYGLCDMSGNVSEMVFDAYLRNAYENPGVDPFVDAAAGSWDRGLRGGNWYSVDDDLSVARRAFISPSGYSGSVGFRLVRTLR